MLFSVIPVMNWNTIDLTMIISPENRIVVLPFRWLITIILLVAVQVSNTNASPSQSTSTNNNNLQRNKRKLVLGIDGGTESIRACFFDAITGHVIGKACAAPYPTYHPSPGYAEQDPKDWWTSCRIAVRQAIESIHDEGDSDNDNEDVPLSSGERDCNEEINNNKKQRSLSSLYEICAMTIDTTCCSVVTLDGNMEPVRNCLLWMDQRSVIQTQQLLSKCRNDPALRINNHGHGPISAEWMIPKVMWLQQQEPQLWQTTRIICEYQDYINYQLTGQLCASTCNAITRWHYNGTVFCGGGGGGDADGVDTSNNNNEFPSPRQGQPVSLYDKMGISDLVHKLPSKCVPMGTNIGIVTKDAALYLGLPTEYDIPVIQGGPDAFVGMIGLGCIESGQLCLITGSSHLHCIVTSQPNTATGIWGTYQNAPLPNLNFAEGGQSSTGSILRWAKRLFGGIDDINNHNNDSVTYKVLDAEAERIAPGSDGLVALETFQGSRTPTTDPLARGALIGLTLSHTRGHIWRALMESVCYGTRACIEGLAAAGHTCEEIIIAGGVTRSNIWLQMHADITGKVVTVCENSDAPLLGCAILASTGVGIYKNVTDAVRAMVRTSRQIHPNSVTSKTYDTLYKTAYKKMLPAVQPIIHALHTVRGGGDDEIYVPANDVSLEPPPTLQERSDLPLHQPAEQISRKEIVIAPSLLACDWANIEREVHRCCAVIGGTRRLQQQPRIHIDIFDGVYLDSPAAFTFGPQMVQAIRNSILSYHQTNGNHCTNTTATGGSHDMMIMDLHMCVDRPERFVEIMDTVTTGVDCCFIFQWEAMNQNVTRAMALIHLITNTRSDSGCMMQCGISINPSTDIEDIYPLLRYVPRNAIAVIDLLAVEPGFGGQPFQSDVTIRKVHALHQFRIKCQQQHELTFQIMIDGGMNNITCVDVVRVGADILVVGTFLFQRQKFTGGANLIDGINSIYNSIDQSS